MASPVADTYSAASGVPVYGGRYPLGGRLSGEALLAAILAGGGMGAQGSELSGEAVLEVVTAGGGMAVYPAPIAPPTLNATRAHVRNVDTGQVYYIKNANTTDTVPASCTKMMTCYVLLQNKTYAELEDTVTVVSGDLQIGSGANLLAGDVISWRQLIANAIRPSSNSACAVIARCLGQEFLDAESGGVGNAFNRFMTEMNSVSAAIGMTGTTWYNPAGLNGSDYSPTTSTNITTPADLNIVMGLLWDYPVLAEIWDGGTQYYDMPIVRGGSPTTLSIELVHGLRSDTGIIGGKTGTTTVANSCALWQAPSGDVIAISVFNAGTDGRFTDSRAIITQLPIDFPELDP